MTFDPISVEVLCVTLPKDHCVQVPWKYIKVCGYIDLFCKNLKRKSLTPRWPLTPHLLRSHVWLYPRIIVSKSHGNTSMYADTVINFAKNYYIHTHTYIHIHTTYRISDHIVSFWTTFRRDKKGLLTTVVTTHILSNYLLILNMSSWIFHHRCMKLIWVKPQCLSQSPLSYWIT